ncbi:MAG: hypothetical protein L6Q57_03020 [Alphaproteobacteria bacterium]|nr:hypothetical protein [Alphaproteobacteria bacterium]
MKKLFVLAAAAVALAAPVAVFAEEHAAPAAAEAAAEVKELTLKDGTKVHVKGEEVFVVGADGTETPAPDGTHTLSDDTTVTTAGGKLVH